MFELAPALPGSFTLAAIVAPGFLPFAPELTHSSVRAELVAGQAVRGVTVFLFPALPYHGLVVDAANAPVAGAKVRLIGTPQGEQAIEKLPTEFVSDAHGKFTFNAPDFAVFEAVKGNKRGWAALTSDVATTRKMTIKLGDAPARDATIRGKTLDTAGNPIAEVLVRAVPAGPPNQDHTRALAFALSNADGVFVLEGLDKGTYAVGAEADEYAPAEKAPVMGGAQDVQVVANGGAADAGILAGDRLTAVDGIPVTKLGMDGAVARIRGVAGTTLAVSLLRGDNPMMFTVTRKPLRF